MRDESASIVVISGTNSDGNNVCQLPDEPANFTRLLHPGFDIEHVEQITGNTDEVVILELVRTSHRNQ